MPPPPSQLRVLWRKLTRRARALLLANYPLWIRRHDSLDDVDLRAIDERVRRLNERQTIAILLPVFDPPVPFLQACIDSVKAQRYPHWQLCICDDASRNPAVVELLQREASAEPRIRLARRSENGHISRATNDALALADATWTALLDHDDMLRPHALALVAEVIERFPQAELIYSDEDKVDARGTRRQPYFKPDWNPALLLGQNYLCHLSVYRRDRLMSLGGMRPGFEGAQDHDLALRFTEGLTSEQIVHIPHILYHWRKHPASTASLVQAKTYTVVAARRAVTEALQRRGITAEVETVAGMWHAVRPAPPASAPRITVVIPTRDGLAKLPRCIDTLLSKTRYPAFEVLVIDNGSSDPRFMAELDRVARLPRCRVRRDDRPFNFAGLMNAAVAGIVTEYVLLLNDDTEVITPDWMDVMLGWCGLEGIGAVGARLWYPNQTLQHGGIVLGIGEVAGHAHRHWLRGELGDHGRGVLAQDFSACTAACLLVRRQVYLDVGGMDEAQLAVAFNDVDFCLKLRRSGWRIVWTPEAELLHYESATRGSDLVSRQRTRYLAEVKVMHERWRTELSRDPAYNPNLTQLAEDFRLAREPRVSMRQPWYDAGRDGAPSP